MLKAMQEENLQLAKAKRDKERKDRGDLQFQENHELGYTVDNDFMTENPATTQSQLAPHRVKPYHFKGLNAEQQAAIMGERAQQLKEQEMLKQMSKEQDRLWALQQEHMRKMQIKHDREMKRNQRTVANGVKETHTEQNAEHKIKWKDPYGDRS